MKRIKIDLCDSDWNAPAARDCTKREQSRTGLETYGEPVRECEEELLVGRKLLSFRFLVTARNLWRLCNICRLRFKPIGLSKYLNI
jgi:hypothetical protein